MTIIRASHLGMCFGVRDAINLALNEARLKQAEAVYARAKTLDANKVISQGELDKVAAQIRSAGAIFVGPYSPVSLGDYCAGSNHVLPTAGSARHSSGLSVQTFLRGIHVVDYTEAALKDVSGHVVTLAKAEDLPAHGEAVRRRFER